MNTKAEIIDAIEGQYKGDLPPPVLLTQTGTREQMQICGAAWPDAHRNTEKMVKLALQPSELFGFATARVPYDVSAEAEAIGCEVSEGTDISQPVVTGSPWRGGIETAFDTPIPSVNEFLSADRIRTIIDAARILGEQKDELFVTSMCISSTGIATHMLGMENMIMATMIDMDSVAKLIDMVLPLSKAYASELSKVSDNVMLISDVLPGIMTPECIRYSSKNDKEIVSSIRDSYSTVHNCGNTFDEVDQIVSMSPDIISLEASSRPADYLRKIGKSCRTLGCINPVTVLLPGTPEAVRNEALRSAELGFDLVGPECGVPPLTPNANLKALADYRL